MAEIRQQYLCFVMGLLCDFRRFRCCQWSIYTPFFPLADGGILTRRWSCPRSYSPSGVKQNSLTSAYLFAKAFFYAEIQPILIAYAYIPAIWYRLCLLYTEYAGNIHDPGIENRPKSILKTDQSRLLRKQTSVGFWVVVVTIGVTTFPTFKPYWYTLVLSAQWYKYTVQHSHRTPVNALARPGRCTRGNYRGDGCKGCKGPGRRTGYNKSMVFVPCLHCIGYTLSYHLWRGSVVPCSYRHRDTPL